MKSKIPGLVGILLLLISIAIVSTTGIANATSTCDPCNTWEEAVISCDQHGQEKDIFKPGEDVYIKAYNLDGNEKYDVWITPYPVNRNDILSNLGGPGQLITINTSWTGNLGITKIWTIPSNQQEEEYYSIVLDKHTRHWHGVFSSANGIYADGEYDELWDIIDVRGEGCNEWSFIATPELSTIALFSIGLVCIGGYFGMRIRRTTSTN